MNFVLGDIPILIRKDRYLADTPVYTIVTDYCVPESCGNGLMSLHQHQFIEISYIISGCGSHRIWNKSYPAAAGDLYILNTAVPHSFFPETSVNKLIVRSLYFDPQDLFGHEITEIGSERYLFGLFLQSNFAVHVPLDSVQQKAVGEKFDAIRTETERKLPDWQEAVSAELTLLLLKIKRFAADSKAGQVYSEIRGTSLVASVVHLIEKHYGDSSFSLKNAAEFLHINPSSVSRKFYEVTGKHFSDYLCSYRMQQAASLALETDLSNEEIALMCGYNDFSSFYRQFRQIIGTTPGEFRKSKKTEVESSVNTERNTLYDEIADHLLHFRKKETVNLVNCALEKGLPAEDILNKALIPGMDAIGKKFRENKVFVVEVLAAAKAMKSSMELLKPYLMQEGIDSIGCAIICTVKGDMHDIGKSLVKLMMEGQGIDCIDLGVDVDPTAVVNAVREHGANLVCLSALLTTTMMAAKDTIDSLVQAGLRDKVRIMVGGAPVTEEFAKRIGADSYTPDAASAAKEAKRLILEMTQKK